MSDTPHMGVQGGFAQERHELLEAMRQQRYDLELAIRALLEQSAEKDRTNAVQTQRIMALQSQRTQLGDAVEHLMFGCLDHECAVCWETLGLLLTIREERKPLG